MARKHARTWIDKELRKVFPAIVYFSIAFNLTYFTVGLTLPPDRVRYYTYLNATVAGVIMGKIIMIVDKLPFLIHSCVGSEDA